MRFGLRIICEYVSVLCRNLARSLGEAGEIEPETEGILMDHGIDSSEFTSKVTYIPERSKRFPPAQIPFSKLRMRRFFQANCHQSSTIPPWPMCVTIQGQTATSHQPFHPDLCVSLSRGRLPPVINHSTLVYVCHYPGADCHQSSTIPP